MPSLAPEDGVVTCPYRLQAEDFEQDGLIIQKGTYNVVWDAADNVPSEVREQLSGEMQTIARTMTLPAPCILYMVGPTREENCSLIVHARKL